MEAFLIDCTPWLAMFPTTEATIAATAYVKQTQAVRACLKMHTHTRTHPSHTHTQRTRAHTIRTIHARTHTQQNFSPLACRTTSIHSRRRQHWGNQCTRRTWWGSMVRAWIATIVHRCRNWPCACCTEARTNLLAAAKRDMQANAEDTGGRSTQEVKFLMAYINLYYSNQLSVRIHSCSWIIVYWEGWQKGLMRAQAKLVLGFVGYSRPTTEFMGVFYGDVAHNAPSASTMFHGEH